MLKKIINSFIIQKYILFPSYGKVILPLPPCCFIQEDQNFRNSKSSSATYRVWGQPRIRKLLMLLLQPPELRRISQYLVLHHIGDQTQCLRHAQESLSPSLTLSQRGTESISLFNQEAPHKNCKFLPLISLNSGLKKSANHPLRVSNSLTSWLCIYILFELPSLSPFSLLLSSFSVPLTHLYSGLEAERPIYTCLQSEQINTVVYDNISLKDKMQPVQWVPVPPA